MNILNSFVIVIFLTMGSIATNITLASSSAFNADREMGASASAAVPHKSFDKLNQFAKKFTLEIQNNPEMYGNLGPILPAITPLVTSFSLKNTMIPDDEKLLWLYGAFAVDMFQKNITLTDSYLSKIADELCSLCIVSNRTLMGKEISAGIKKGFLNGRKPKQGGGDYISFSSTVFARAVYWAILKKKGLRKNFPWAQKNN